MVLFPVRVPHAIAGQGVLVAVATALVETSTVLAVAVDTPCTWALTDTSEMVAPFKERAEEAPTGQYEPAGHGMGMEHEPEAPLVPAVALVQAAAVPVATGR
jgi:hypothetical protein